MYIYPGSSWPPFFSPVGFRTTIFYSKVYHLPKGTTIFQMVVGLPGYVYIYIYFFFWLKGYVCFHLGCCFHVFDTTVCLRGGMLCCSDSKNG